MLKRRVKGIIHRLGYTVVRNERLIELVPSRCGSAGPTSYTIVPRERVVEPAEEIAVGGTGEAAFTPQPLTAPRARPRTM